MLGRTLESFGAERKPDSYAQTCDCCCAKEQQSEPRKAVRSVATDQESDRQEKKPVSCPAMERHRIRYASVINDIEWLGGASEAHSQSHC